ncbi:hypothetical protein AKJ39_00970 [candidate division MSBL1 archaeon SCGC-AAA259J03]|uniref:Uncharacterized protein n=1 Tax=candidate division MSBL1 archaeon SCGC-AAA259J03 TaxID=1698269 RepID=A0A656YXT6_9EURY|nr:hypothetical protein AKJ39_00970 [candidate division MSBL1 archaeon SCGC-AAA259J03]
MVLFIKYSPKKRIRKKLKGKTAISFARKNKKNGYLLLDKTGKLIKPEEANDYDKIKLVAPLAGG